MAKNLLIVESPAKAKTIEKYLGKDFEVSSSFGHIRDLEKEGMGIDIANGFMPHYKVSADKKGVVATLKSKAAKAQEVWLATDEDREGEAISWHLCEVLGLQPQHTKRIVFHEITETAIKKAVQNPRLVDLNLVDAQQARRVLDRLVGFEISPVLWRKLSGSKALSAGRVQSVAVKLIVEREREIINHIPETYYRTEGLFSALDIGKRTVSFKAEGKRWSTEAEAQAFLDKCIGATYRVADVQVRPAKQSPSAPFTTSTLQQEASRKLGYNVSRTMRIAQQLYESGSITYMRTDSVNLSDTALQNAQEAITRLHGAAYHQRRTFKSKHQSAQEAHEAIRPTDLKVQNIGHPDGQRLYDLIWKRTIASQMADAQLEKTTAHISIHPNDGKPLPEQLTASGEVIKFEGFLKVYLEGKDDEEDEENKNMLPPLAAGQVLPLISLTATQRFTRSAARYTEASLVKKLEELGIGRPSTYAPTISTVQARGYVARMDKEGVRRVYTILQLKDNKVAKSQGAENTGAERAKLFPTDLGMVVTDFLNEHFTEVMDYGFTANIENEFDEIAQGNKVWNKVVANFYKPFHERVEDTMEHAERAVGERILGTDPDSGKPILARLGRFGPMVQIGEADDEEKPRFASLKADQSIATITFEEALDLFKLPLSLGEYEGQELVVNIGRFGPYVKFGEQYVSIPKGEEPLGITKERAIALVQEKQAADAPIATFKGQPVTKGKGRFGPFLKYGDVFVNVPARYDFEHLAQTEIEELISAKLEKEAKRYIHQWAEPKLSVENGRWGPFIRFGKKMIQLKLKDGSRMSPDDAAKLTLDDVKQRVLAEIPNAFSAKNAAGKTTAAKKTAKKSSAKKSASKKPTNKKK